MGVRRRKLPVDVVDVLGVGGFGAMLWSIHELWGLPFAVLLAGGVAVALYLAREVQLMRGAGEGG